MVENIHVCCLWLLFLKALLKICSTYVYDLNIAFIVVDFLLFNSHSATVWNSRNGPTWYTSSLYSEHDIVPAHSFLTCTFGIQEARQKRNHMLFVTCEAYNDADFRNVCLNVWSLHVKSHGISCHVALWKHWLAVVLNNTECGLVCITLRTLSLQQAASGVAYFVHFSFFPCMHIWSLGTMVFRSKFCPILRTSLPNSAAHRDSDWFLTYSN